MRRMPQWRFAQLRYRLLPGSHDCRPTRAREWPESQIWLPSHEKWAQLEHPFSRGRRRPETRGHATRIQLSASRVGRACRPLMLLQGDCSPHASVKQRATIVPQAHSVEEERRAHSGNPCLWHICGALGHQVVH